MIPPTTDVLLYQLAERFREALLACPKDTLPPYLRKKLERFPAECCDFASMLLAHFLRDQGLRGIERVFGNHDNETHVWLEVDGFIVDITPSQFRSVDEPVIVVESTKPAWHSKFDVQSRQPACPREAVKEEVEQAYAAIKNLMEKDS
jgi:hypothetical protein